jgi:signal-transduction protein with cAMP-binding, CBS, and nucleotidyltransferase domain
LITRGQRAVGLMTLHRIKEVPRRERATTSAAEVMLPLEQSKRTNPDTVLWTALQQMDRDGVNQLPVTRDNQVIGMLSREDVTHITGTPNITDTIAEELLNGDEMKERYRSGRYISGYGRHGRRIFLAVF